MGFLHGGQANLELPTSGGPLTSASQSVGIIGMSLAPGLFYFLILLIYFIFIFIFILRQTFSLVTQAGV